MQSPKTDEEALRRWVKTWEVAGEELDRIKQDELRALTEEEAAAQSLDLLRLGISGWTRTPTSSARAAL